jgi:nucleoside-diphosphate kinase
MMERSLVILKPDCVQRNLVGEIISRLEKKGLKIVGIKMVHLSDEVLKEHYAHIAEKPFYPSVKEFMQASPVMVMALEGFEVVEVLRLILGQTKGRTADVGSIRGDYSMSVAANLVHASDSVENAKIEINRFFKAEELFDYKRIDVDFLYTSDEK